MNLALIVTTSTNNSYSALEYIEAAIKLKQTIIAVFFLSAGSRHRLFIYQFTS